MIYISLFDLFYSIWDLIIEPVVYSYNSAIVIFENFEKSIFDRDTRFLMLSVYCLCFAFSLACFGVHFIYRYATINTIFRDRYMSGKNVLFIFSIPIIYGVWWAVVCGIVFRFDDFSDEYLRNSIERDYGYNISKLASLVILIYLPDENGVLHLNWTVVLAMTNLFFMAFTSMFSVIFFGIRCYRYISVIVSNATTQSVALKSLQHQLFKALVIQTAIPVLLMYLPLFIVFAFPIFNINFPFACSLIATTIAIYPAIDPLPSMLIIKPYRKAILKMPIKFITIFTSSKKSDESQRSTTEGRDREKV